MNRCHMRARRKQNAALTLTVRAFTQWERLQMARADCGESEAENIAAIYRCGLERAARRAYPNLPRKTVHRAGKGGK